MKIWTNKEESIDLLDTINAALQEGYPINYGCEIFCLKNKKYNILQARARYYQLLNSDKDLKEETIINPWNEKEDSLLKKYYQKELKKGKTLTKVTNELSKKMNRSFNSVIGRYYKLKKEREI